MTKKKKLRLAWVVIVAVLLIVGLVQLAKKKLVNERAMNIPADLRLDYQPKDN